MTDTRKRLAEIEADNVHELELAAALPHNNPDLLVYREMSELIAMLKPYVEPVEDSDLQDAIGAIHEMNRCSMSAEERAAVVLLRAYRQQRSEVKRLRGELSDYKIMEACTEGCKIIPARALDELRAGVDRLTKQRDSLADGLRDIRDSEARTDEHGGALTQFAGKILREAGCDT